MVHENHLDMVTALFFFILICLYPLLFSYKSNCCCRSSCRRSCVTYFNSICSSRISTYDSRRVSSCNIPISSIISFKFIVCSIIPYQSLGWILGSSCRCYCCCVDYGIFIYLSIYTSPQIIILYTTPIIWGGTCSNKCTTTIIVSWSISARIYLRIRYTKISYTSRKSKTSSPLIKRTSFNVSGGNTQPVNTIRTNRYYSRCIILKYSSTISTSTTINYYCPRRVWYLYSVLKCTNWVSGGTA